MALDRQLLRDIRLTLRHRELRPVYAVDTDHRRLRGRTDVLDDMAMSEGRDNLGQAVILRLLTPKGELAPLAHPDYGSRLHELVGSRNFTSSLSLAKLYVLESLQQEPRIEKIVDVAVERALGTRDRINISVTVKPIGAVTTMKIGPFTLELAP